MQESPAGRGRDGIREGLRKGSALQIKIGAGVSHMTFMGSSCGCDDEQEGNYPLALTVR
jgi:hypothetical protein